jgi:hypothetical protein
MCVVKSCSVNKSYVVGRCVAGSEVVLLEASRFSSLREITKIVNLRSEIVDGRGREGSVWSTDKVA